MQTLKNHERMELSWAHHVHNTEFSVETSLEHGFPIEKRISSENYVLYTIFTITAYKAFLGPI